MESGAVPEYGRIYMKTMRMTIRYILLLLLLFAWAACSKDGTPTAYPQASRVVLAYMAGDNNLSGYVRSNLDAMVMGMASAPAHTRMLAYADTPGENPRLMEITASGCKTLYMWSGTHDSASAETVREVLALVRRVAPADRYGLVLWSHGLAWVPSSATGYLTRSTARIGDPWPATKWFGQDTGETPAGYLETADLAAALPADMFEWILFDACFMSSVETLYALRDKAAWIICSPAEVIADGFPYEKIMTELLRPAPELRSVCETYYRYYAHHADPAYRAATISLVRTSELEELADATASLLSAALAADPDAFAYMGMDRIQPLDRYRRHFLFDMGSVAEELARCGFVPSSLCEAWRAQFARTVVYEAHTPWMLGLALGECCGVSMYVPMSAYPDLNESYETLEWYARCYPAVPFRRMIK